MRESTAWCHCGDELDQIRGICKPGDQWLYYCLGCDKYYQLQEVPTPPDAEKIWDEYGKRIKDERKT